jgi:hypothetical protein
LRAPIQKHLRLLPRRHVVQLVVTVNARVLLLLLTGLLLKNLLIVQSASD